VIIDIRKGGIMSFLKDFSIRSILLATDGSEFSSGAIREAIRLAKDRGARLYIISVAQVNPVIMGNTPDVAEAIEKKTMDILNEAKGKATNEGVEVETIFHEGEEPHDFIVDEAEKRSADVIVMGRRGLRGLKKLMMGSVTAMVIGHSKVPVFVVPRAGELKFKSILVCTDGSEHSKKAVELAINLARACGSRLMAISVAKREELLDEAKGILKDVTVSAETEGVKVETITVIGTPYEAITTTAQIKDVDLIVIGTHGRTGLGKVLMGSVAERVIGLAHCAVLVVKPSTP